jgi:VanZ family protein
VSGRALSLWGPFAAALALCFWLSSIRQPPGGEVVWDKLLHVLEYAGIGVMALRAFHGGLARPRRGPTLAAAATVVLWAVSDELHQSFVPGRDASVADVVADVAGFGLSVLSMHALAAWRGARARPL